MVIRLRTKKSVSLSIKILSLLQKALAACQNWRDIFLTWQWRTERALDRAHWTAANIRIGELSIIHSPYGDVTSHCPMVLSCCSKFYLRHHSIQRCHLTWSHGPELLLHSISAITLYTEMSRHMVPCLSNIAPFCVCTNGCTSSADVTCKHMLNIRQNFSLKMR